ncbi:MAG TPA: phenylalanine--tRNA ligase subunit alpha, partial [Kofleriaceae bacterium]|nr:phenylalanine--tRNA ligase subunit alpha [Kofleriaceae bacterium]
MDLIRQIESLGGEFAHQVAGLESEQDIRALQARYLGKKGSVSQLMKEMGALDAEKRREVGAAFNRVKEQIEAEVARRLGELAARAAQADLDRAIDVSLPGRLQPRGHLHILTQTWAEAIAIFGE